MKVHAAAGSGHPALKQRSGLDRRKVYTSDIGTVTTSQEYLPVSICIVSVAVLALSVWGASGRPWFWVGDIQSEQLQVSYYEPYYASLWF